jgi:peptide/nickel transport system substrate-binding protein
MRLHRRDYLRGAGGAALSALMAKHSNPAAAQSRANTLRHITGATISSLDPTFQGATRESLPLSVNIYDRLVSMGRRQGPHGFIFDADNLRGELAERIDRSSDGLTFTFHVREGATWHDGSPVEVQDIKWSLDRAVTARSFAKAQMAIGSQTSTDQFTVVGDRQLQIKLDRPNRLALLTLSVPFLPMFNSKLAQRHAGSDDPWAINWLKDNAAGGGAYSVESNRPGQQVVLRRNDRWKNGPDGALPFFQRIIIQTVPDVSARVSLVERGDADLTLDAAASDIPGIEQRGRARVLPITQTNAFQCVSFNVRTAPFDDVRVRKAVAAALPYDDMFTAAIFGRGQPLYGATWSEPPSPSVFQPMPNRTDLEKARELLREAGRGGGFRTTFSYPSSASATVDPMAALIKESLARLNIDVTVQKMPDAQFTTMLVERRLAMFFDFGTSWLTPSDYIASNFYSGPGRWNSSGWNNPEMPGLMRMVRHIRDEVPVVLLWHPSHDAVVGRDIEGYTYWFHRGADYRDLRRA